MVQGVEAAVREACLDAHPGVEEGVVYTRIRFSLRELSGSNAHSRAWKYKQMNKLFSK